MYFTEIKIKPKKSEICVEEENDQENSFDVRVPTRDEHVQCPQDGRASIQKSFFLHLK